MHLHKPVNNKCVVTLRFGPYPPKLIPLVHTSFHNAIDFAPPHEMEKDTIMITAAADGIVLHTGFNTTFGNFIILSHETDQNLTLTFYCHLEKILAFRNTNILQGETIAEMGNTGISTSKHLHFMMATLNPSGIRFINPAPHFIT